MPTDKITGCEHTTMISHDRIVDHEPDGEPVWGTEWETAPTYADIDLHRYHCLQCGEVFYYSPRAREFFEQGIEHPSLGLTLFNLIKYGGVIPRDY